ncbi:MAG: hypothetical protein BMS9Abin32_608 [Gammaproteobacteria bacterium]|nr:MAG: hypothetical protein BMS9Abin32_608 [Gammaproteobacteria bacterium]
MGSRTALVIAILLAAPACWAQAEVRAKPQTAQSTVIGPRNVPLHDGAQALLAGQHEIGVQLTLQGLKLALGKREEEAALANLCAGYFMLQQYDEAMKYCDLLLQRNDSNWRAYNNRALIYLRTKQYRKADEDLTRGEAINPGARTLKTARAMYLDAVNPVAPAIEIDDRQRGSDADGDAQQH